METNLQTQIAGPRSMSGEGWAALLGVIGSLVLVAKKLFGHRAPKPEPVSRAEFFAEMLATRERLNTAHLALLNKLEINHREALAALERQGLRIGGLETAVARLEERSRTTDREEFGRG